MDFAQKQNVNDYIYILFLGETQRKKTPAVQLWRPWCKQNTRCCITTELLLFISENEIEDETYNSKNQTKAGRNRENDTQRFVNWMYYLVSKPIIGDTPSYAES